MLLHRSVSPSTIFLGGILQRLLKGAEVMNTWTFAALRKFCQCHFKLDELGLFQGPLLLLSSRAKSVADIAEYTSICFQIWDLLSLVSSPFRLPDKYCNSELHKLMSAMFGILFCARNNTL
jgi:hypothetical protein